MNSKMHTHDFKKISSSLHPIEGLFDTLPQVRPYLSGMVEITQHLPGLGFFPGGDGLWKPLGVTARPTLPTGGVLVLGNNFQCEANYPALLKAGSEDRQKDATWRNLLSLFEQTGIDPSRCFFTNAFMGLVAGSDPTATVPAMSNPDFVARCRAFFLRQVQLLQPRLILSLGSKVPSFLAPLSATTGHWKRAKRWPEIDAKDGSLVLDAQFQGLQHPVVIACILHPSFRGPNLRHRTFRGMTGAQAEAALLQAALEAAGIPQCR